MNDQNIVAKYNTQFTSCKQVICGEERKFAVARLSLLQPIAVMFINRGNKMGALVSPVSH